MIYFLIKYKKYKPKLNTHAKYMRIYYALPPIPKKSELKAVHDRPTVLAHILF